MDLAARGGTHHLHKDPSLKRCYGADQKILDCDWDYLSTMRTLAEPHEPLPRLEDILQYLTQPGLEKIWLLLDIKVLRFFIVFWRAQLTLTARSAIMPTT